MRRVVSGIALLVAVTACSSTEPKNSVAGQWVGVSWNGKPLATVTLDTAGVTIIEKSLHVTLPASGTLGTWFDSSFAVIPDPLSASGKLDTLDLNSSAVVSWSTRPGDPTTIDVIPTNFIVNFAGAELHVLSDGTLSVADNGGTIVLRRQ